MGCDIYKGIDPRFWDTKNKKYFIYKCYLRDTDALFKTLKGLKLYLETNGIPYKNIKKCRKNLQIFKRNKQSGQGDDYRLAFNQVTQYLEFFVEYYDVLVEMDLEPITKTLNDSFGEGKTSSYRAK